MLPPTRTLVHQACRPRQEVARLNANILSIGLAICFLVMAGCAPQGAVRAASLAAPPRRCEIQLEAWCILKDNNTIEVVDSAGQNYRYIWTIRGAYWLKHPSLVLEPAGCRIGRSDVLELISFDRNVDRGDRKWDILTVRLRSDASCDLKLLSPVKDEDPIGAAFSANLSLIRACQTNSCDGPTVGEKNAPKRD